MAVSGEVQDVLRRHNIQPSAQRVAVGEYVLRTADHPSADRVFEEVKRRFPVISRATVYNTLNLFVSKGLLRQFVLTEGRVVFDPNTSAHHHFVDDHTGEIHDIPWEELQVRGVPRLAGDYDVDDYQVVVRGRKRT